MGHFANPFLRQAQQRRTQTQYMFMFDLIFIDFVNPECDGSKTFQTSCYRGNKQLGKLCTTPKTPIWDIPQVSMSVVNRRSYHNWV